jgi:uncharacterized membrane protein
MSALVSDLLSQMSESFRYNLQVLPDTLMAASLLFSLLFQSVALLTLFVSLLVHAGVHNLFAGFLGRNIPGLRRPSTAAQCSGTFPGTLYTRAATMANGNNDMTDGGWPSYYASFMGFLIAYLGSLTVVYAKELKASPQRRVATQSGLIVALIVLAMCVIYRLTSGCDDVFGILAGLAVGGVLGAAFAAVLAYISDRTLTNVLSLPLLTSTAADGKPLYVCSAGR